MDVKNTDFHYLHRVLLSIQTVDVKFHDSSRVINSFICLKITDVSYTNCHGRSPKIFH
jgi:hypothetical protein